MRASIQQLGSMLAILANQCVVNVVSDHPVQLVLYVGETVTLNGQPKLKAESLPLTVNLLGEAADHQSRR
jgi:hypothetical protein